MWEIDTHEPAYIDEYFKEKGLEFVRKTLNVGDYVYNGRVGFERKNMDLFNFPDAIAKVDELRLTFPGHAYLILDLNFDDLCNHIDSVPARKITKKHLYGIVAGMTVRGVPPIFCSNARYMVDIMCRTAEKAIDGKPRDPRIRPIKGSSMYTINKPSEKSAFENPEAWRVSILTSLPRVGERVAKQILADWGSPGMFFALDPDEAYNYLRSINTLTPERAKMIVNVVWGVLIC